MLPYLIALAGMGVTYLLFDDNRNEIEDAEITNYKELKNLMGRGITVSENFRLSEKYSNEHILIVAPSGMGKTQRVVIPNVNRLNNELCSVIVTDPKCEIEQICNTSNKKELIFNPYNHKRTIGYDPLLNCKSKTEVRKIAKQILVNGSLSTTQLNGGKTDDSDWIQRATKLLTAYMLWNWKSKKYSFDVLVKRLISSGLKTVGKEILDGECEDAKLLFTSFIQVAKAQQTLACIMDTLSNNLEMFIDDNVSAIMRKPSIDLSSIRDRETILYIQVPERDSVYFSPLTSVFVSQLIDRLLEDKHGLQTYMLFDEFANIGRLSNLPQTLSTCRSRNISITACIQSLNQLEIVYDKYSKVLTDLFKTTVFMAGLKDSAEYASNLTGMQEKEKEGVTGKVLTSDQIRRLNEEDCLIICGNKQPVIDKLCRIGGR